MSGSRHFTVVDDWVILNQEINSTEFRVYAILRAAILNEYGGIPTSGLRVTAGWVSKISGELFSRTTAHRALRGLAAKGVLSRLNNPKEGGEGAEFEFVVYPGSDYKGVTNVQAEVAKLKKKATRSIHFKPVEIDGNPKNGLTRKNHVKPSAGDLLGQPDGSEPEESPETPAPEPEEPEFDFSFDQSSSSSRSELSAAETEFAIELEALTSQNPEEHLRMLAGPCRRVARAMRPVLERGWEPKALAVRLAAELNPRVRLPENLLMSKADDFGDPPPKADPTGDKVLIGGKLVDLSSYDVGYGWTDLPSRPDPVVEAAPPQDDDGTRQRLAELAKKSNRY